MPSMRSLHAAFRIIAEWKTNTSSERIKKNRTAANPQELDKEKAASRTRESGWFHHRDGIVNDKELYLSLQPAQLMLVLAQNYIDLIQCELVKLHNCCLRAVSRR